MSTVLKRVSFLITSVVMALVIWYLLVDSSSPIDTRDASAPLLHASSALESTPESVASISAKRSQALADSQRHLPSSLIGTTPDGEIERDAQGQLRPTLGLRRLFDYFLSAMGEVDLPAIRAMLRTHVQAQQPSSVVDAVLALFDRYVDYQRARALPAAATDTAAQFAADKALRRQFFDADTALAFFGEEETYTEFTLTRLAAQRDTSLSESERVLIIEDAMAALTPAQRASMRESSDVLQAEAQSQQFEAQGIDADARFAARSAQYGQTAAHNLALLDQQRMQWNQQLATYQTARDAIRANERWSAAEREQQLDALRRRSFDEAGARRVIALESVGEL